MFKPFFFTISISLFLGLLGCKSPPVTRLDNPKFTVNEQGLYQNQYPNTYNGKGPHHPYDKMEFRQPFEIKEVDPKLINVGSFAGYHKSIGFNYQDILHPNPRIDPSAKQTLTWLGHASFLIQLRHTESFLTDPVLGEFDGIIGWLGRWLNDELGRLGPAPVTSAQLQFVDAAVISHNHYDHLSVDTLNALSDNTQLLLPLGVSDNIDFHQGPITEMDWYTQTQVGDTVLHFLPAHHFSRRGLSDWNKTLWGAWLFDDGEHKIFFAGDTGYSPIYDDIRHQHNEIDICLMPIIAYDYTYRSIHLAPEDAVKAAQDLNCKVFIPWGYGTWLLGYEHVNEPIRRLQKAFADLQPNMQLKILKIGESVQYTELLQ